MTVAETTKLINSELGPVLYGLEAGAGVNVQGVSDADNNLGALIMSALNSIRRKIAGIDPKDLATRAIKLSNKQHERDFVISFKKGLGVDLSKLIVPRTGQKVINSNVSRAVQVAISRNVQLIKTIPSQYLNQVEKAIFAGLQNGDSGQDLKKVIMELNGQNERRAKLIARDQLQKLTSELSKAREQDAGITGYIWRTSADERVREDHKANDGKRFNWNSPPSTGHPGEAVNCRCIAEPDMSTVLPWLSGNFEKG